MARLLFCEDDQFIRTLIGAILRRTGHDVVFATNGDEGLAMIERDPPALVFTDRHMPGLAGFGLCDALKARAALAQIPIILFTASTEQQDVIDAYQHGVTAIPRKPCTPAQLQSVTEQYLSPGEAMEA